MTTPDVFAVTFPDHVSDATLDEMRRFWREYVGDRAHVLVMDGGAQVTRLVYGASNALVREVDRDYTPIFDALVAEHGNPHGAT